jgi:predicted lipid-binding transport protein (Tim44 family)
MIDLILFAALALFVLIRLFNTLGKIDSGHEMRNHKRNLSPQEEIHSTNQPVDISIASAFEASLPVEIREVFDKIRVQYPKFNAEQFLNGARNAFPMILEAFAKHDAETLRRLLTTEIFKTFKAEIDRRKASGLIYNSIVLMIKECEITQATFDGQEIVISLRIVSEQINSVTDAQGNLIEGDPNNSEIIEDNWSFAKKIKSPSAIWLLAKTDI